MLFMPFVLLCVAADATNPPTTQPVRQHGVACDGLRLTVTADRIRFKVGDPVLLRVIVENFGDKDALFSGPVERDFIVSLHGAVQRDVRWTRLGKSFQDRGSSSEMFTGSGAIVLPKTAVMYSIRLDDMFDLTMDDLYTVSVSTNALIIDTGASTSDAVVRLESNQILFEILHPDWTFGKLVPISHDPNDLMTPPTTQPIKGS
jgi:hypothetical protein